MAVAGRQPAVPLVRVLRHQALHPGAAPQHPDHDRRPRRPRTLGDVLGLVRGVELALERHLLPAQQRTDDLQRLLEAADPPLPRIAERHVLGLEVAGAEAQDEAPIAELVDGVGHSRKQRGVAVARVHHQGADLHPAGLAGKRRGGHHALPGPVDAAGQLRGRARAERLQLPRRRVAEVIDQPQRVEPELLGPARESHDLRAARGLPAHRLTLVRQTESDLHLDGLLRWFGTNGCGVSEGRGARGRASGRPCIARRSTAAAKRGRGCTARQRRIARDAATDGVDGVLSTGRGSSATARSPASRSTRR